MPLPKAAPRAPLLFSAILAALALPGVAQEGFVNWESPHVHPLELMPDGARIVLVNTADARIEVFELATGVPVHAFDVPVGLDPVSVRAASNGIVWVVNRVSDSISVVDLAARNVVATLATEDEPADVVFAGDPRRAYVSCSGTNALLVFDPAHLAAAPGRVAIDGEEPRALAVSNDGKRIYAAIFASGNDTTILAGGSVFNLDFPPNVVNSKVSPYSGANPPPNTRTTPAFEPPLRAGLPTPPRVGLIVRHGADGAWRDDSGGDWTHLVSGPNAALSGRVPGWELVDHDLAVVDATTHSIAYTRHLMNTCMALAVHPKSGEVAVVGTDARNEVRFEPNVRGRFLRVLLARVVADGAPIGVVDLNPHLDYASSSISRTAREASLGDPRALAWNADGTAGWIAGLGSDDVVQVDAAGARVPNVSPIDVGTGPTGLAYDTTRERLYVLCRFDATLAVVDPAKRAVVARVSFFDPTPAAIRAGREHLYDTHSNSGLGQIACASCHVDARMDHLAWDLGDPSGELASVAGNNLAANNPALLESKVPGRGPFQPFHPMKGPMVTQTLQDIVGKEPLHWRGDRAGLEAFAGAFRTLQGSDTDATPEDMQELEAFLATIAYPPNPYRDFDNGLRAVLALPGHVTTGRFGPAGKPLPDGRPRVGLERFRTGKLDNLAVDCVTCHTLPTGTGPDAVLADHVYRPLPPGPLGERHAMLVSQDGSTNVSMKVPQLRNLAEKVGFDLSRPRSRFGFGFTHDGSVDTLARFVNENSFTPASDQDTADLVAFLLSFRGSDLPVGSATNEREPPGPRSRDTHAAVGAQATLDGTASPARDALVAHMVALAETGRVGLVAKGRWKERATGFQYAGAGRFQSDRAKETCVLAELVASAKAGSELTLTVVPAETARRLGVDRDGDGAFDGDELDAGASPRDAASRPASTPPLHPR
ncbi:MAG: beta-propeller fold lactonase family protein [Planctomycetes bacterium]|nr:beta-propeller fold lactonase family protein [Planctomycetota bacterium]